MYSIPPISAYSVVSYTVEDGFPIFCAQIHTYSMCIVIVLGNGAIESTFVKEVSVPYEELSQCARYNTSLSTTTSNFTLVELWTFEHAAITCSLVEVTGLEPAAPCSQSTCATKLRYTSILAGMGGFEPTYAGVKVPCLYHLATPLSGLVL